MSSAPLLARTIHGRAEATARLNSLVEGGGAVVLVGEAGIGKTRLARYAAERAGAARMSVLEGHATLGAIEPLGLVCDLVRAARRAGVEPPQREREAAAFPAMVLPELGGSDGAGLGAIQDAAARYIRAIAGTRGALVVLEDLHWADATSLGLIAFTIRALRGAPATFVLTHRPAADAAAGHLTGFRAELARERLAEEISLTPLTAADAAAMLTEVLGGEPAPEVAQELLRLAEGNPFALEELARAAVESGWLDPHTGSRGGAGPVALPWTLAESIVARAAALEPEAREVLAWALALGQRVDALLLAEAAGMGGLDAGVQLDTLADAGFLVALPSDDGAIAMTFRHALVLEALSREGGALRRRARHARILAAAETLVDQGRLRIPAAELARHALAAGDRDRALAFSRAAGDHARELGAVEEATVHAERALSLWAEPDGAVLRAELLWTLGFLLSDTRREGPRPLELLREATALYETAGDQGAAARCRAAVAAHLFFTTDEQLAALAEWERALPALRRAGATDALRRALSRYGQGLVGDYRIDDAQAAVDEGLAMIPDPPTAAQAYDRTRLLTVDGFIALTRGDGARARDRLRAAVSLAVAHHDDLGAAGALRMLGLGNLLLVTLEESLDCLRRCTELAAAHGLRESEAMDLGNAAFVAARGGAYARADELLHRAEELIVDTPDAGHAPWYILDARADLLAAEGQLEQAMSVRRDMAEWPVEKGSYRLAVETGEELATVLLLAGEHDAAIRLMGPYAARYLDAIASGSGAEVETFVRKVILLEAAGQREDAATVLKWARGIVPDHTLIRYGDALLSLPDDPAVAAIAEALAARDAQGWRADAGRLGVLAAHAAHRADGGHAAAVALARGAHTRFRELGADPWCRRIEATLRQWGERAPTRLPGPGAGGLSQRELEVLALVANGLTNHQIAQQLVISDHTAIRHVANLMAKLGAPNRAAAVTIATERGLLTDHSREPTAG